MNVRPPLTTETLAGNLQPFRELDDATRRLLHEPILDHDGTPDWPRTFSSLALRFWNNGRSQREFLEAVTDPAHAISAWYRELRARRGRRGAEDWLLVRWHRAGRRPPPARRDNAAIVEQVDQWLAAALAVHPTRGRAGATDRAVRTCWPRRPFVHARSG